MAPESGKSVVALGLMELLSGRVDRLGFFRPIVPTEPSPDPETELMRRRYRLSAPYERMHALTEDEASRIGEYEELRKRVVEAYKELEQDCDFVLCEGSDFTGAAPALDFGRNADLANELGCPVLVVVRGEGVDDTVAAVHAARNALKHKSCDIFGVAVNRVPRESLEPVSKRLAEEEPDLPVYILPEQHDLAYPTVDEVADALDAEILFDHRGAADREVRDVRVAAMSAEHFLDDLVDGALVVASADRPDILVASLASALSPAMPTVAGVVLVGSDSMSGSLRTLLENAPFPVLQADGPLHVAVGQIQAVKPSLRAEDERKIATALGVFESSVDQAELGGRLAVEAPPRVTPLMFEYELIERAKSGRRHVVLPEGDDERVLRAAEILLRRDVVDLTILGAPDEVNANAAAVGVKLDGAEIVDPLTSDRRDAYAGEYFELRKHKGVTEELAFDVVADPSYFATMMVREGAVDGMVSGAAHTTGDTIRPAFEVIKAREGVSVVSSVFFMCLSDRVLVYGDCAVNPNPSPQQLADIAISSAETASSFGIDPLIAMLSYSTGQSGRGEDVDAVREATEALREQRPDLKVEGPIQYDAATDPGVAAAKAPESEVAGRATVFIFPDLDTGNVAYKAVQRTSGAVAIGPVLQGLRKPVNDLSRGCTVTDVVNTVAITAIQAQDGASSKSAR